MTPKSSIVTYMILQTLPRPFIFLNRVKEIFKQSNININESEIMKSIMMILEFRPGAESEWRISRSFFDPEIQSAIEDFLDQSRSQKPMPKDSKNEWHPTQPSSDSQIWRYIDFTQLLSILERSKVWFSNNDSFNDPYEGTLPDANAEIEIEEVVRNVSYDKEPVRVIHQEVTKDIEVSNGYVNCWNINSRESAALWEQYCNSPQAVAISTTVGKLKEALKGEPIDFGNGFIFGKVKYIDYNKEIITVNKPSLLYHKRKSFEHENEFRVSFITDTQKYDFGSGRYVDVDVEALIKELYLSPHSPQWFVKLVEQVLQTYDVNCDMKTSDLY